MAFNMGKLAGSSRLHYILTVLFALCILFLIFETSTRSLKILHHAELEELYYANIACKPHGLGSVMKVIEAASHSPTLTSSLANNSIVYKDENGEERVITSPLSFYSQPFALSLDPSRRAYATTLYGEGYLEGALALGYSLRKHGMLHPDIAHQMLLLHIPGRVSEESLSLLRSVGWTTVAVKLIPVPKGGKPPNGSYKDQYTKLRLFELEQFDQIFYLDADSVVVKPFPEIWSYPVPFAAARDVRIGTDSIWLPTINAGTLLVKPNRALMRHMLEVAPKLEYEHWFAEQALLNEYWLRDITLLPYIFNGQLDMKRGFPKIWEAFKADIRIIHYTWTKPWKCEHKVDQPTERGVWLNIWDEMIEERRQQGMTFPERLMNLSSTGICGQTTRVGW